MTQLQEKKIDEKVSSENLPLKTEEIVSILNKTNKAEFLKDDEVLKKIRLDFKSSTLKEIAEKNNKTDVDKTKQNLTNKVNETELESKENIKEEKVDDNKLSEKKVEDRLPEKIYSKEESDKIANDLAKIYYQNGYNSGVKNIKIELEKGEQAIAMALKNTIDNLFHIAPDFLDKMNQSINSTILDICSNIVGYEIESVPEKFVEKITLLVESIENSSNKIKVILNPDDNIAIKDYLEKNKPQVNIEFQIDKKLQRGDLIIKSGGIEINDIVCKKVSLVSNSEIKNQISELKQINKNLTSDQEQVQKRSDTSEVQSENTK